MHEGTCSGPKRKWKTDGIELLAQFGQLPEDLIFSLDSKGEPIGSPLNFMIPIEHDPRTYRGYAWLGLLWGADGEQIRDGAGLKNSIAESCRRWLS